jgi:hypothetical protein
MSKIPAILSATLTVSLAACGGGSDKTPIGQPVTTPVVTSEPMATGTLTVYNSTDGLFVTATAEPGYEFLETRLAVSTSLDGIPKLKSGGPNLNRFLLRRKGKPAATELSYNLPLLVQPGTELFIALHADVRKIEAPATDEGRGHGDCDEGENKTLSAWAQGSDFAGGTGAMYLTFIVKAAGTPSLAGLYRTQTQAQWGAAESTGTTTYLWTNFSAAFPSGATIGLTSGNTASFTTSSAVTAFLPQSGMAAMLSRRTINPADLANSLAGETLALTLNAGFDGFDPAFSASDTRMVDLVIADPASPCYGLRVSEVLTTANTLLSGRQDPMGLTLDDALDAVERINANFENGTADLGFLARP